MLNGKRGSLNGTVLDNMLMITWNLFAEDMEITSYQIKKRRKMIQNGVE